MALPVADVYNAPAGQTLYAGRFPAAAVVSASLKEQATLVDALAGSVLGTSTVPFMVARTGVRYATLGQAVAGAISGDTIKVAPGTYVVSATGESTDPGSVYVAGGINLNTLTIEWETPGSRPIIDMSAYVARAAAVGGRGIPAINGSGSNRSLTVRGLHLIGARAGESYGINFQAGYVYGGPFTNPVATLTIDQCKLVKWSDGVKTTYTNQNISVYMTSTTVEDCSEGDQTHGIYVQGDLLDVLGCTFRTTVAGNPTGASGLGHLLKSRMKRTKVRASLFDMKGGGAACIEAPVGGDLEVYGNIILKYQVGDGSNPPIKYGFEEIANSINVSLTGSPIQVGDTIVGSADNASGVVTAVKNSNTTLVYRSITGGNYFDDPGQTILVGGVPRAVQVGNYSGSIDGSSNDGRTHRVRIGQNTIRQEQRASWPGGTQYAVGMLWISPNMTTDAGDPISNTSILAAGFVRNNIVADIATGNRTVANIAPEPAYPDNSPVEAATVSIITGTLGVYSGSVIAGSPAVRDADYAYAGEFVQPVARTGTNRGGFDAQTYPTWRQGQTPYTWRTVSSSSIQAIDPANNAALNPNGAGNSAPWRGTDGQKGVIDAWGAAVWDEANLKLWLPLSGGHNNYGGNECYVQPLGNASPTWTMPRAPTGAIGNLQTLNDGQESTGVYADGRPRSIHPYSNLCYAPGVGPVITRISAPYSDSNQSSQKVFCLDPTTGESRVVFDWSNASLTGVSNRYGGTTGAACLYDPVRNRVVTVGIGNPVRLLWCTPSATPGTWSGGNVAADMFLSGGSAQSMVYIPTIDRYLHLVHFSGTIYHKLIHPDTGAVTDLGAISGSLASGYSFVDGDQPGACWAGELGVVGVYNHTTTNTGQISTLTYPGNLVSKWVGGTLSINGANAITPAGNEHGAFGLFGWSDSLRGFYRIPQYPGATHFFAVA